MFTWGNFPFTFLSCLDIEMAESSSTVRPKDLVLLGNGFELFELDELLSSSADILGEGTFGFTYEVHLEGKDAFAVKRFKIACLPQKEFCQKVERLAKISHENLLPLRGYCCYPNVRRLLYEYMPVGSLFSCLHGSQAMDKTWLSWEVRSNIVYGTARAIKHIHSLGPSISHGNIKSSNILLTSFYDARVSEFGLTQLLSPESQTNLATGYCAPEVKCARDGSQKADVYSFGILILEVLTGRDPIRLYREKGVELGKWVRLMFEDKPLTEVLDREVLDYTNNVEQMVQMLELAICCTFQYYDKRPLMDGVVKKIKKICNFVHDDESDGGFKGSEIVKSSPA